MRILNSCSIRYQSIDYCSTSKKPSLIPGTLSRNQANLQTTMVLVADTLLVHYVNERTNYSDEHPYR